MKSHSKPRKPQHIYEVPVYRRPSRRGANGAKRELVVSALSRVNGHRRSREQRFRTFACLVSGFSALAFVMDIDLRSRRNAIESANRSSRRAGTDDQLKAEHFFSTARNFSPIRHRIHSIAYRMNLACRTVKSDHASHESPPEDSENDRPSD